MVQIYLSLSQLQGNRSCRYKIPLTGESITFRNDQLPNGTHINIFPHNRQSNMDRIILEMWGDTELIGIN